MENRFGACCDNASLAQLATQEIISMKNIRTFTMVILSTALLTAGCQGAPAKVAPTAESYAPVIDPADFVTVIDNPYMPLIPGTRFVYDGTTEKGNEHNEVYITSEMKVILGVTCVVVNDTVMVDGAMEEQTLDWYAQDTQGNVWYFGEDSKDY